MDKSITNNQDISKLSDTSQKILNDSIDNKEFPQPENLPVESEYIKKIKKVLRIIIILLVLVIVYLVMNMNMDKKPVENYTNNKTTNKYEYEIIDNLPSNITTKYDKMKDVLTYEYNGSDEDNKNNYIMVQKNKHIGTKPYETEARINLKPINNAKQINGFKSDAGIYTLSEV